ncbi:conjugal transfer protein TraF [Klebsiella pneumoniae]|uniref:conjugal transfer protein TraF n=1 Tax=Klebsiella pneumoniae TaxID=573 RepID=UPI00396F4D0E
MRTESRTSGTTAANGYSGETRHTPGRTKRSLYEAILYPSSENFVKYFRLQNYWTQQAGLFSMSAKPCWKTPNSITTCSTALQRHGKNQLAADYAERDRLSPPSHSTTA